MTGKWGLFRRMVSAALGLISTATAVLNPACSRPKSRPIAPEKREITCRFVRMRHNQLRLSKGPAQIPPLAFLNNRETFVEGLDDEVAVVLVDAERGFDADGVRGHAAAADEQAPVFAEFHHL